MASSALASAAFATRLSASSLDKRRSSEKVFGTFCFARRDVGPGGREIELSLIPARIDGEKHVAFLYELPGLETDIFQVSGNAGAQLHRFSGVDASGNFLELGDELNLDRRDGDFRCGRLNRRG